MMMFPVRISGRTLWPGRILAAVIAGLLLTRVCAAGLTYDMEPLEPQAISQLSDEKLLETYINLLVELDASTTFSIRAGFSRGEYVLLKRLLRMRYDMYREITKRKLEVPPDLACR